MRMRRGGITVFLSLTLLIVLALFAATLRSVRLSAARFSAANSLDQAVFSLFSNYDKDLLAEYDVFFLDGGQGGHFAAGQLLRYMEDSADAVLHPEKALLAGGASYLPFDRAAVSLEGYTTAAEGRGLIFAAQAIEYMRDTLGIQGVQRLLAAASSLQSAPQSSAAENGAALDTSSAVDGILEQAAENAQEAPLPEETAPGGEEASEPAGDTPAAEVPADFKNPLDTIRTLQHMTLLDIAVPDPGSISDLTLDGLSLPSERKNLPSLGIVRVSTDTDSLSARVLFAEYLLTHCGYFTAQKNGALLYQAEYLLAGKKADRENLLSVLKKLLLLRIGPNMASIYADAALHAAAAETAAVIAAALTVPELTPLIEGALIAGWAFCESVMDLRALLSGKRIPLMKNAETFMVNLESLPLLLSAPDSLIKDSPGGLSYPDYLRFLLLTGDTAGIRARLLDLAETTLRTVHGRTDFRIDHCIDTIDALLTVHTQDRKELTTAKRFSYREEPEA